MKNENAVMAKIDEDRLIELWNCQKYSMPTIAEHMGLKLNRVKYTLKKLQGDGIIYCKNTAGKLIIPKEAIRKNDIKIEKEGASLQELMGDIMNISNSKCEISIAHKEMLIEILHRII